MSENTNIETRIRNLRKKILKYIMDLPFVASANIFPEALGISSFYNKNMFNALDRGVQIAIGDSNGNIITSPSVQVFESSGYDIDMSFNEFKHYESLRQQHFIPVVVSINGNDIIAYAKPSDIRPANVTIEQSEVKSIIYPSDYPPDYPLNIKFNAYVYRATDEENYDVYILVGSIGYVSQNRDVFWRGMAALVLALSNAEIVVKTRWGRLGKIGNEWIGGVVVTSVFSTIFGTYSISWA